MDFLTVNFIMVTGCQPVTQPPPGKASPRIYDIWGRVAQPFPGHQVPILVVFYDLHELQWDYSFHRSPHGVLTCLQGENLLSFHLYTIT